ncbi:MAG TPA: efflux RND transporter periplasmic adaptor subunit [Candidatus Acidoferrum sp.]|nr:efflux RND transporter periplasmic adaptor subunit [Candidatus Acidoferrum sp.]
MAEKQSRSWIKWAIIVGVVIMVAAGAAGHFRKSHSDAPAYQTTSVSRGELMQVVTATGTLNPVTNVQVGCQVSGRISKIYVDFNSPVKAGQVIAEIDPSTYQAAVAQATADLANAHANLELQQIQARRSSDLFTNNLISGSDYDTAIANLHEAEAMVKIKEASLSNAMANLGYCKICSPVDGVVISRAVDVGQTVASSFNTPTLFQIANDLTQMQIDSNVAEADIGGVEDGQAVTFNVDAYPYRTFHGTVTQVRNAPTTVNNVVTYDCVIAVENPDYKLKPGMTANPLNIVIAQRQDALKIPNAALRFRPPETNAVEKIPGAAAAGASAGGRSPGSVGGQGGGGGRPPGGFGGMGGGRFGGSGGGHGGQPTRTVYLLSGQGKDAALKPVQIKTGVTDGVYTEVLSGLSETDRVVTGLAYDTDTAGGPARNPFAPRFR